MVYTITAYVGMALYSYDLWLYIVIALTITAYVGMTCMGTAFVMMVYIVTVCIVTALYNYDL